MALCQAKRTNGEPCKAQAVRGKRVCRVHGGMTPSGIASPHFKTGRYSKALPARMLEAYTTAASDPQLLEQREQIAVLDARLIDLLARVDTGESGAIWQALMQQRMDFIASKRANDVKGQTTALNTILDLITEGHTDYRAWGEVQSVLEQRRRLVESERKRQVEMQQMVTSQQVMVLVSALLESVKRNVSDRAALAAIQTDFIRLTARDDSEVIDA